MGILESRDSCENEKQLEENVPDLKKKKKMQPSKYLGFELGLVCFVQLFYVWTDMILLGICIYQSTQVA